MANNCKISDAEKGEIINQLIQLGRISSSSDYKIKLNSEEVAFIKSSDSGFYKKILEGAEQFGSALISMYIYLYREMYINPIVNLSDNSAPLNSLSINSLGIGSKVELQIIFHGIKECHSTQMVNFKYTDTSFNVGKGEAFLISANGGKELVSISFLCTTSACKNIDFVSGKEYKIVGKVKSISNKYGISLNHISEVHLLECVSGSSAKIVLAEISL